MKQVDVLVIGAGIQGAGIAQSCAAQGWTTLVLEKNSEPAMETSSRSSKLIHGGLRYLETAQFKLVYECLKERSHLLVNASDIVSLVPFYIPVYANSQRHPVWIALGLCLYGLLAFCAGGWRHGIRLGVQTLPKEKWHDLGLNTQKLKKVFFYLDAQTDDALLTRRVVASAAQLGAEFSFNAQAIVIDHTEEGFIVTTQMGEKIRATSLVNTAGPWVNQVASLNALLPQATVKLVQGTHIVVDRKSLGGCLYAESPTDGRAVFILPWKSQTLIGTTERELDIPLAKPSDVEVDYLLEVYNHYLPDHPCTVDDIVRKFAGIRVLPQAEAGTAAHKLPRETVYAERTLSKSHYIGLYGGKLTSYRATADVVLKKLAKAMGRRVDEKKLTHLIKL